MLQRLGSLSYLGAVLILFTLAACDLVAGGEQSGLLTPTAVSPLAETTPDPANLDSTIVVSATVEMPLEQQAPLKIWVPADPVGLTDEEADELVAKLMAFANSPAEAETIVQEKALSGPGSILSYLRTGRGVADAALPDLVILPADQLETAVSDGLVYPLEEFLDRDAVLQQLYPAAAQMAQVEGELVGYPFALTNMTHLAYDTAAITETLPLDWGALISSTERSLMYPANSVAAATFTWQLYQSAGGGLQSEPGQSPLLSEPLVAALTQLQAARTTHEFISVDSLNVSTYEQAWENYRNGAATIVLTTVEEYWLHRTIEPLPAFQAAAGLEDSLTPLVDGWVIVLTATELRRPLAIEFLQTVVSTQNVAEWSNQQLLLPADQGALALWADSSNDVYLAFLQSLLLEAQPNPLGANATLAAALQNATFGVLSLSQTPQEAAQQAVDATTP
ncbi:MAG: extracellular solute-binding protein [Chloroflexota bacterium]